MNFLLPVNLTRVSSESTKQEFYEMILSQHLSLFNMKCLLEVHDKGAGSQSLFFSWTIKEVHGKEKKKS